MEINVSDIVVLEDDKEYGVTAKAIYKNRNYYQLVDMNKHTKVMYCYQENDDLIEIHDKELIALLMPIFIKSYK